MTDLEDRWNEFDEFIAYNGMLVTPKMMICNKMLNLTVDEKILSEIRLENDILLLWHNIFWIFDRVNTTRFSSEKQEFIDKMVAEVNDFVNKHREGGSYCLHRYSVSKNESDKIRYSFLCWFFLKNPKYLLSSIDLVGDAITRCLDQNSEGDINYSLACHLLSYAYTMVELYIPTNSNAIAKIRDKSIEIINVAKQNNFSRWLIEPSEILAKLLKSDDHDLASKIIEKLYQGADQLSKEERIPIDSRIGICNIERSILETSTPFTKFMKLTEGEKEGQRKLIRIKIARSYEREAQLRFTKGEHALVIANICYLPAAKEYQLAGEKEKSSENFILYQKNNYFPADSYREYHIIVPKSDSNIFEGNNEEEIIKSISENDDVIPDQKHIEDQINSDTATHPIALGIPHQKLTEYGPAAKTANEPEDIKNHLINEMMVSHIQLYENFICQEFFKLEETLKITNEGLMKYISKFLILDSNTKDLIRFGLTHHFNRDYVASIHILMPQLENVLRIILKNSNINVLKLDKEAIMNKLLRTLLDMPEVCELIGNDFSKYLVIKYADLKSINLRNHVSHGLLKVVDFNHANSCALIYGLLKLLDRFEKNKTKSPNSAKTIS